MTIYEDVVKNVDFKDRFVEQGLGQAVDVIIPLLHSTPFWKMNLFSYYREVPVNRLIIGNAGAIDGSDEVAVGFPRVEMLDHSKYKTLGKSLAELMSRVETEHFIYLQSDTFLPNGWFDVMWARRQEFDWFGCPESPLVVLSAPPNDQGGKRPLAGTQFGRTSVFSGVSDHIQDDYGYRQEDFIFEDFVLNKGASVGKVLETFHVHQITERKTTGKQMSVKSISVNLNQDLDDERVSSTQLLGFVKYCSPKRKTVWHAAYEELAHSLSKGKLELTQILSVAKADNQEWTRVLMYMYFRASFMRMLWALPRSLKRALELVSTGRLKG